MKAVRFMVDRYFIKWPWLRQTVTRALWGDRNLSVDLLGASLCANTVRENGYCRAERIAAKSSFWRDEAAVIANLGMLLRDGDTFIDIGANVGVFSKALSRFNAIDAARVAFYAFEANADTFRRLEQTLVGTGVKAFCMALSDEAGEKEFVEGAVSHVFTAAQHASAYNFRNRRQLVRCARLDEMDLAGSSFVLKIDVEGQELAVLKGAKKLFDKNEVKAVYCDGYKDAQLVDFLRDRGFRFMDGRTLSATDGKGVFSLLAVRVE